LARRQNINAYSRNSAERIPKGRQRLRIPKGSQQLKGIRIDLLIGSDPLLTAVNASMDLTNESAVAIQANAAQTQGFADIP
jgi:hypothetical protein